MAVEKVRDVLEHARMFHGMIADYYRRLSSETEKERVKMLIDYLSRHEAYLEKSISEYAEGAARKTLDTWVQFSPCQDMFRNFEEIASEPHTTTNEVIKLATKFDNCLVNLYKEMSIRAETEELRTIFDNLLNMEEEEEHKVVKNALRFEDI